jgi:DNA repair protein RecO (recombination protein O)
LRHTLIAAVLERDGRAIAFAAMPLYKEQGIVLRSHKLGEADKIVSILTQGSGKVRAVAKGIRKTRSRFGARLEPFTHVSLLLYRGKSLDTVTQAEIISPFVTLRGSFDLIAAGETMLEATDKVAEEHERNVRLFLLLLAGMRALDRTPRDPAAVAEAFLLRMLSLSGFHPSLSACAVCGSPGPHEWFDAGQGGVVCGADAEPGAGRVPADAVAWLDALARCDLETAGEMTPDRRVRRDARPMLYGFVEYHLERRMRSFALLVRQDPVSVGAVHSSGPAPEPNLLST